MDIDEGEKKKSLGIDSTMIGKKRVKPSETEGD